VVWRRSESGVAVRDMSDVYFLNATNATPGLVAWTTRYTGTCTGTHTCTVTVEGRGGRTGTAGTMNAVPPIRMKMNVQ
jgi:hypothetical protein